jgi:hypothetical protein
MSLILRLEDSETLKLQMLCSLTCILKALLSSNDEELRKKTLNVADKILDLTYIPSGKVKL